MIRIFSAATLFLAVFYASQTLAQDAPRYQLQQTEHGIVRLDTATGELTYCREDNGGLDCGSATPDKTLSKRIKSLEERMAALERKPESNDLPTDEELEHGFSIMEKFMRRFKGFIEEWEQDSGKHGEPLPQKT